MARVNITVPDEVVAEARTAGLNVSRLATAALVEELDRRGKVDILQAYLTRLEAELGPISIDERAEASGWADRVLTIEPSGKSAQPSRRHRA